MCECWHTCNWWLVLRMGTMCDFCDEFVHVLTTSENSPSECLVFGCVYLHVYSQGPALRHCVCVPVYVGVSISSTAMARQTIGFFNRYCFTQRNQEVWVIHSVKSPTPQQTTSNSIVQYCPLKRTHLISENDWSLLWTLVNSHIYKRLQI